MNVLVVGGTGFVGTALVDELVGRGHEVAVLARDPEEADLPPGVERVAGDVTDYDGIAGAFAGRDAVVNLVALSPLFTPDGGPEMHERVHLRGTEHVVRAAEAHGVARLLQVSALGADPEGPTAYVRAKGKAERVVRDSDLSWTVVRPSVVFGDGGEFLSFTRTLTTPYLTGLPGGGATRFQPVWVGDLAGLLADALADEHAGETYELGGPEVLTLADVTRLVYRADGRPVDIVPIPMALARVGLTVGGAIPGFPMGPDQYRSLAFDNTTDDNDAAALGRDPGELRTLSDHLGVTPDGRQSNPVGAALAGVGAWIALMAVVLLAGLATGAWRLADVPVVLADGVDVLFVTVTTLVLVGGPVAAYVESGLVAPLVVMVAYFLGWAALGAYSGPGWSRGLFVALLYGLYGIAAYALVGGGEWVLRRLRAGSSG